MSIGKGKRTYLLIHQQKAQPSGAGVTSVTLWYNSQQVSGSALGGMLFRVGSTYTLVAKDQNGNVLDGTVGAWSSSDATNAPINASTGVVSPSALTGATFTYTHTASGHTGTASATILPATTPIMFDAMGYANDAALRANILNTVTSGTYNTPSPTGSSGTALYRDGVDQGLVTPDGTRPYMGRSTLLMTFPAGVPDSGQLHPYMTSAAIGHAAISRQWLMIVKRYDPGFTPTGGTGIGGAATYKDTATAFWANFDGRGTIETDASPHIILYANLQKKSDGSNAGGVQQTIVGNMSDEWTSGKWLVDIVLDEVRSSTVVATKLWRFYLGSHPVNTPLLISSLLQGAELDGQPAITIQACGPFGLNYNQTRSASLTLYKSLAYWEVLDGTVYGDPYGLLGDTSNPTLTGISGGTVTHGTNNNSIVLTGTNFTANCWPVFSNAKVYAQSITVNSSTQMTVVVDVDATATTGAGTVLVHNGALITDSATQAVTVN